MSADAGPSAAIPSATDERAPTSVPAPVSAEILRAEPDLVPAGGGGRCVVLQRLLLLADALGALVAGVIAGLAAGVPADAVPLVGAASAILLPLVAFACGLYVVSGLRSWATGVPDLRRLTFVTLAITWPVFIMADAVGASRAWLAPVVMAITALLLVSSARAAVRGIAHRAERLQERTAIVGSGLVAEDLVHNLRCHRELGLAPVGIIDNAAHHRDVSDVPHLGGIHDISNILRREAIDRVIIAFSRASHVELLSALRACRDNRVPVHVVPRLFEFLDGMRELDHVGGMPILSLGMPRLTPAARTAKRGLDITVSAAALVLLMPFFAVIALAIKLESPGPVLFSQRRGGRGTSTFKLLKFRSMYRDAEERRDELLDRNEMRGGVMFKLRQDPRITRVGRLLRRYSLDELPQLWNVLRGEMSLVGPRPLVLPETAWLHEEWQVRRSDLRPGLTGTWQVYGRSEIPFEDMVRYDYQYVAGWSLARDLEILFATVPAVLSGRGAY